MRSVLRGYLLACVTTVLCTGPLLAVITPAAAAPGDVADLSVRILSTKASVPEDGGAFKSPLIEVRNNSTSTTARNVRFSVDVSALAAVTPVTVTAFDTCSADETQTKVTCALGDLGPGAVIDGIGGALSVSVGGGEIGVSGLVTASITSDTADADPSNNTDAQTFELVGAGVDVVANPAGIDILTPGDSSSLNVFASMRQFGAVRATAASARITLPGPLRFVPGQPGCSVAADLATATCTATMDANGDGSVQPTVTIDPNAPFQALLGDVTITWTVPGQTDIDPGDNVASFPAITTKRAADLAVVGRNPGDFVVTDLSLRGKVGDVLRIEFVPWNNGPAVSVDGLTLTITAPTGTSILSAAPGCQLSAGGRIAHCATDEPILLSPRDHTVVRLRVVAAHGGKDGSIVVSGSFPDPDPTNNLQRIAVTVTGPPTAGAGGTGGTGGAAGAGSGGGLPATGAGHPVGLTLAGLAALVAGAALTLAARRRRRPLAR